VNNVLEWMFSAVLVLMIASYGLGYYTAKRIFGKQLVAEEARALKWKTRAYKMAWRIPLDDSDMRETKHALGLPKASDYRKTHGGLWTSCK
jgi:hypothetical protein